MVTNRQKLILKAIVEEYVKTCEPIGSKSLIENPNYNLDFSSATIRNEMAILEELGYIKDDALGESLLKILISVTSSVFICKNTLYSEAKL